MNLFINCCFRDNSRTLSIAQEYLAREKEGYEEIILGKAVSPILDYANLNVYGQAMASNDFSADLFKYGKMFAEADKIVIAAPYWNNSIPAVLHAFLEIVTSQGVTFNISPEGEYQSLCQAQSLVFVTTAGGYIPKENYAYGYIKSLAKDFWKIKKLTYIKAEGLDIAGANVAELCAKTCIEVEEI